MFERMGVWGMGVRGMGFRGDGYSGIGWQGDWVLGGMGGMEDIQEEEWVIGKQVELLER